MEPLLVLDTNSLISAALSPKGQSAKLLDLVRQGSIRMVMSDHLLYELESRLEREKFRRWLSLDDVALYVDAIAVMSEWVDDRPDAEIPLVCDDPDDNFLVALYQDAAAQMLVSGDKAVLRIDYPNISIYKPADALEALNFTHHWGEGFTGGNEARQRRDIKAEGNAGVFAAYSAFSVIIGKPENHHLLPAVVVPETLREFQKNLGWLADTLCKRGMASRPIYQSAEIALIKLPPDPGVSLRAMGEVELPRDTIFATMQRCPDLQDPEGVDFDHWRVWGIGGTVPVEQIRPRPTSR